MPQCVWSQNIQLSPKDRATGYNRYLNYKDIYIQSNTPNIINSKYMQFNPTSHHHPYFNNTTHRVPPPLALHSSRNPSQRISQVSSSQRSRLGCPSTQRISTVSSQKMSVATRADLVGSINLINSQTYRTENMRNFS